MDGDGLTSLKVHSLRFFFNMKDQVPDKILHDFGNSGDRVNDFPKIVCMH